MAYTIRQVDQQGRFDVLDEYGNRVCGGKAHASHTFPGTLTLAIEWPPGHNQKVGAIRVPANWFDDDVWLLLPTEVDTDPDPG